MTQPDDRAREAAQSQALKIVTSAGNHPDKELVERIADEIEWRNRHMRHDTAKIVSLKQRVKELEAATRTQAAEIADLEGKLAQVRLDAECDERAMVNVYEALAGLPMTGKPVAWRADGSVKAVEYLTAPKIIKALRERCEKLEAVADSLHLAFHDCHETACGDDCGWKTALSKPEGGE